MVYVWGARLNAVQIADKSQPCKPSAPLTGGKPDISSSRHSACRNHRTSFSSETNTRMLFSLCWWDTACDAKIMTSVKCILGSPRPFFCCLYATFASIPLLSQRSRLRRTQTWGWVPILTFTQVISFQQTPVLLSVKWGYNCLLHKVPAWIKWHKTHTTLRGKGSSFLVGICCPCRRGDLEWRTEGFGGVFKNQTTTVLLYAASLPGYLVMYNALMQSPFWISKLNPVSVPWEKWFAKSIWETALCNFTQTLPFSFLMDEELATGEQAQPTPVFTKGASRVSICKHVTLTLLEFSSSLTLFLHVLDKEVQGPSGSSSRSDGSLTLLSRDCFYNTNTWLKK